MKSKILSTLCASALLFVSCSKFDFQKDTPSCIKKEIRQLSRNKCGDYARATEYEFQGEIVFVLSAGNCPDGGSNVFNRQCDVLGLLGGVGGNTIINGEEFSSARLLRVLWED